MANDAGLLYHQIQCDEDLRIGNTFAVKCISDMDEQVHLKFSGVGREGTFRIKYMCAAYSAGGARGEADVFVQLNKDVQAYSLRSALSRQMKEVCSVEILGAIEIKGHECNRIFQLGRSVGCHFVEYGKRDTHIMRFINPSVLYHVPRSIERFKFGAKISNITDELDCNELDHPQILFMRAVQNSKTNGSVICYLETTLRDEYVLKEVLQELLAMDVDISIRDFQVLGETQLKGFLNNIERAGRQGHTAVVEKGMRTWEEIVKIGSPPTDWESDLSEDGAPPDKRHLWVLTYRTDFHGQITVSGIRRAVGCVIGGDDPSFGIRRLYNVHDGYWGYVLVCFDGAVSMEDLETIMMFMKRHDDIPWCGLDMDEYGRSKGRAKRTRPKSFTMHETLEQCRRDGHPAWNLYKNSMMTLIESNDGEPLVSEFMRVDPINPSKYWLLTYGAAGPNISAEMVQTVQLEGSDLLEVHTLNFKSFKYSLLHFDNAVTINSMKHMMDCLNSSGIIWQNLVGCNSAECLNLHCNPAFRFMQKHYWKKSSLLETWSRGGFRRPNFMQDYAVLPAVPIYEDDTDDVLKKVHVIDGMSTAVGMDVVDIVLDDMSVYFQEFKMNVVCALAPLPNELWVLSDAVSWWAMDPKDRADFPVGCNYVLKNRALYGFGKIGLCNVGTPFRRIQKLSECMPERFQLVTYIKTQFPLRQEQAMHSHFAAARSMRDRKESEFFDVNEEKVKQHIVDLANGTCPEEFDYTCFQQRGGCKQFVGTDVWDGYDAKDEAVRVEEKMWLQMHVARGMVGGPNVMYVYAVINPCFEYLIKIGETSKDSPKQRVLELSSHTPKRFRLISCIRTTNSKLLERQIHERFAHCRHKNADGMWTEYFKITAAEVVAFFETRKSGVFYD